MRLLYTSLENILGNSWNYLLYVMSINQINWRKRMLFKIIIAVAIISITTTALTTMIMIIPTTTIITIIRFKI